MRKVAQVYLLAVFCAACLMAQGTFVYTNNDLSPNSVSAFSAAADGALSPIPGSPFATGANGAGGGFFASNRITTAVVGDFLYAANSGSNSVSAFSINSVTGTLTPVPGSPFATGGVADGVGMSLTATPDDKFLIVANGASVNITVYSVGANGTLSQVADLHSLAVRVDPWPAPKSLQTENSWLYPRHPEIYPCSAFPQPEG